MEDVTVQDELDKRGTTGSPHDGAWFRGMGMVHLPSGRDFRCIMTIAQNGKLFCVPNMVASNGRLTLGERIPASECKVIDRQPRSGFGIDGWGQGTVTGRRAAGEFATAMNAIEEKLKGPDQKGA